MEARRLEMVAKAVATDSCSDRQHSSGLVSIGRTICFEGSRSSGRGYISENELQAYLEGRSGIAPFKPLPIIFMMNAISEFRWILRQAPLVIGDGIPFTRCGPQTNTIASAVSSWRPKDYR